MAKILIIDDNEEIRSLLRQVFQATGHEVAQAADGDEGLRSCRAQRMDVVITDIVMPNKEGLETIMELRREFPGVKIVAMSGGARSMAMNFLPTAKKLGADFTIAKPFAVAEMLALVDEALGQPPGS